MAMAAPRLGTISICIKLCIELVIYNHYIKLYLSVYYGLAGRNESGCRFKEAGGAAISKPLLADRLAADDANGWWRSRALHRALICHLRIRIAGTIEQLRRLSRKETRFVIMARVSGEIGRKPPL